MKTSSKMEIHNFKVGETVNVLDYNPFKRTCFLLGTGKIIDLAPGEDRYIVQFKDQQGTFEEERYVDPYAQGTIAR